MYFETRKQLNQFTAFTAILGGVYSIIHSLLCPKAGMTKRPQHHSDGLVIDAWKH